MQPFDDDLVRLSKLIDRTQKAWARKLKAGNQNIWQSPSDNVFSEYHRACQEFEALRQELETELQTLTDKQCSSEK